MLSVKPVSGSPHLLLISLGSIQKQFKLAQNSEILPIQKKAQNKILSAFTCTQKKPVPYWGKRPHDKITPWQLIRILLSLKPYKADKPWSLGISGEWWNSWNALSPNEALHLSMGFEPFLVTCSSLMKSVSSYPSSYSLDPLHLGFLRRSSLSSPDGHLTLPSVLYHLCLSRIAISSAKSPAGRKMGIWVGKLGKKTLILTFQTTLALCSLEEVHFSRAESTFYSWDSKTSFSIKGRKSWNHETRNKNSKILFKRLTLPPTTLETSSEGPSQTYACQKACSMWCNWPCAPSCDYRLPIPYKTLCLLPTTAHPPTHIPWPLFVWNLDH